MLKRTKGYKYEPTNQVGVGGRKMCSAIKHRAKKEKKRPKKKKILEISHFWAGPEEQPIDAIIERFERKYPHVKAHQNIMDWWTYKSTIKRQMREVPPDVIVCDVGETLTSFAGYEQLMDLTGMWRRENFLDVFPEWMKEECSFRGSMYGVPSKYFTYAVWYLTDVFKEHGIKPPKTWDEFMKVCQSFKEAGISPIMASGDNVFDWFMNLLARIGGAEFYEGLLQGTKSWTDSKVIKTCEMLREFLRKYFYPHPFGFNSPMAWVKLNKREAAMYLQGDWLNGMWQREYHYSPRKEYDYFLPPPIDRNIGQVMVVGGNAWMVPKRARHPSEAKRFVEYAGSREAHELMARKGMGILARKDVPKTVYDPIYASLRDELTKYPTVHAIGAALPLTITSTAYVQIGKIILNPNIPRRGIEDLVAEIEMVAKEHRALEYLYAFREGFTRH